MPNSIAALRRKLEKWELAHLRQHAADLAERLERAQEDVSQERNFADHWHEQATTMMRDLMDAGSTVGLTMAGQVVATPPALSMLTLNDGELYVSTIVDMAQGAGYHLTVLPGDNDDASHAEQKEWAKSIGGTLPTRVEQAMLWEKLKDQFKKECYWSDEAHASGAGYAWSQSFSYGDQNYDTCAQLRARAVRRLPFQLFSHFESTENATTVRGE